MNCDQVFDVLTRGPFPTGDASDLAVEAHLADCVDCARLAEALRPAIELFEEAVTEEESRTLPGYWGALAELPGDVKLLPVDEPRAARRERIRLAADRLTGPLTVSMAWRMAAAVLLGFFAMTIVRELKWPERQTAASPRIAARSNTAAALQPRLTAVGMQHIALLRPSRQCFSDTLPVIKCEAGEGSPPASGATGLNCCNACHAYSTDPNKISQLANSTALRACQECHAN